MEYRGGGKTGRSGPPVFSVIGLAGVGGFVGHDLPDLRVAAFPLGPHQADPLHQPLRAALALHGEELVHLVI